MGRTLLFLASLLLLLLLLLLPLPSHSRTPIRSAYDELAVNGFPVGILPADVLGYSLNRTTGEFAVDLGDRCKITLPPDNYLASYSRTVTGRLKDGKIAELDGIRVWAFFRWWSITGIRLSGDNLVFQVGVASATYASKNFREIPECEGRKPRAASA